MDQGSNSDRQLIRLLRELAMTRSWTVTSAFTDWIVEIVDADGRRVRVFGYDFGVNASSAAELADDKAATSHMLAAHGVPCVEHCIVFRPDFARFAGGGGTYRNAFALFEEFNRNVVCKNNRGTGGMQVHRARSEAELENAMRQVFSVHYACAISPYLDISQEIRVIMVDGEATAVFSKRRPSVTADGTSTLAALIAAQAPVAMAAGDLCLNAAELTSVPAAGCSIELNWRHNLGQGAAPEFDIATSLRSEAVNLARAALLALGLHAASVDVVVVDERLRVLEVNSGIMVENLSRSGDAGWGLALETYRRLVELGLRRAPTFA